MNFEHPSPTEKESQEKPAAEKIYEAQGLAGPSLDFSRSRGAVRREIPASEYSQNNSGKQLYESVLSIIDTEDYAMTGSHPEDIMDIIGLVATENQWTSYEDINFDLIRKELEANNVPLRPRKTGKDLY